MAIYGTYVKEAAKARKNIKLSRKQKILIDKVKNFNKLAKKYNTKSSRLTSDQIMFMNDQQIQSQLMLIQQQEEAMRRQQQMIQQHEEAVRQQQQMIQQNMMLSML